MSTVKIEDWWPKTIDEFCVNIVARYGKNAVRIVQNLQNAFCGGFVSGPLCTKSTCTKCPASDGQAELKKEFLLYLFNKESQ